jgi:hypothetical protein
MKKTPAGGTTLSAASRFLRHPKGRQGGIWLSDPCLDRSRFGSIRRWAATDAAAYEKRPRYARDDAAGQQCEIENPRACRACISRAKRIGWGYSSELSGSPEQRPRSEWPIPSTTSNALSSCARSPSHDRLVLRQATHSTITQLRSG